MVKRCQYCSEEFIGDMVDELEGPQTCESCQFLVDIDENQNDCDAPQEP